MSASREKNKRKELAAGGAAEKETTAKKGMSKSLKTVLTVVCIVLAIAVIAFFAMMQNGFFASHTTAAIASGHKLTPAMMNYFYRDAFNQVSSYASYFGIDTEKPLRDQIMDEETGETWADYFMEQGAATASTSLAIYDEAKAEGFELDEAGKASIDEAVNMLNLYAAYAGAANADAYLAAYYGTGCNTKNFRDYAEIATVANLYATEVNEGFTYSAVELAAEYAANAQSYDGVTYRLFTITDSFFSSSDDAEGTDYTEKKEALANEMAEAIGDSEDAFIAESKANAPEASAESYEDDNYTRHEDIAYGACPSAIADWLFDSARVPNECNVLEADGVYYVIMFLNRDTHDYQLPGAHHILIEVAEDADDVTRAAAKAQAEDILNEYSAGEQSYEAFAALGDKYLADGTSAEAALYENIEPGKMVTAFSDWCFDETRQEGDVGIVETEYGYHVMYFYGFGRTYRDTQVEAALRNADYTAWQDAATADASYELKDFGMRFVTK